MDRFRFCLLAVFVGGAAIALEAQRKDPARRPTAPARSEVPTEATPWPEDQTAGSGGGCKLVGGYLDSFSFADRYRGNAYQVDRTVTLTEIQMELGMNASTPLHVAVHVRDGLSWVRHPEMKGEDYVIASPMVTGEANPIFYSTGELDPPVLLEAGFDYAIAFAWEGTVAFGKDFGPYPQATPADFDIGQILGQVALNGVSPPIEDDLSLSVFSSGAYSMQLCLAGACCLPMADECADLSENECLLAGGQFTASGVTCEDLSANNDRCPLRRGACCTSGSCLFINSYKCEARNGSWVRSVFCDDPQEEPCAPRGGCCFNDERVCENSHTVTSCENANGIYRGDGIPCEATPPCTAGACCAGIDSCSHETPENCNESLGEFKGLGTNCGTDVCTDRGACCDPSTGVCEDDVGKPTCTDSGRSFRGDQSTCATLSPTCGKGACCIGGVGCEDADGAGFSQSVCEDTAGGAFRGDGTTCRTVQPRCPGTCCWAACTDEVEPEICRSKFGGTFLPYDQSCENNPCGSLTPIGCCLPSGDCTDVSSAVVCTDELFGTVLGDICALSPCEAQVPLGSCCDRSTFTCENGVRQADCPTSWTEGVDCEDLSNPCEPRGACCDRNQLSCTENRLQRDCEGLEWTALAFCDDLTPVCAPEGACCIGTDCAIDTDDGCFAEGGIYQGDDTICEDQTCAPRGACCVDTTCSDGTELDCDNLAGAYQGDDTICEPQTCSPRGACCVDTACSVQTELDCGKASGVYLGDDTACEDETCLPTGACCVGTDCFEATETRCTDQAGEYQGNDTICEENTCRPTGACCDDLACSITTSADCAASDGRYLGDDTACDEGVCVPTGACCEGADCRVTTQADCETAGGAYVGDGSACTADTCAMGACCEPADCTCTDDAVGYVCIERGGRFLADAICDEVDCSPIIVASDPPDCAIDARQPHPPLESSMTDGIRLIVLEMSCTETPLTADDFMLTGSPGPTDLTIDDIVLDGAMVEVHLSDHIPVDEFTCVQHVASGTQACVGYLPGDVDGNATTEDADVSALVADLDLGSLPLRQCDMDRSGRCTPLDVLRNIDLQQGAEEFATWGNHPLAAPCPTAP